jgi:gamma-glutamyltranspeptidase/glutathione hydrolase
VLDHLCEQERAAGGRERGLKAVHEAFYRGDIATYIDRFSREREGLLTRADLERFSAWTEKPVDVEFNGTRLFKCGPWNQGPAMLACLRILEAAGLDGLEHNSPEYLHLLVEAIKLAYADREQYFADPRYVDVPVDALLEPNYAGLRAALIDPDRASDALRPGDPRNGGALLPEDRRLNAGSWGPGTVHVDVIDREGNMVAATPSGAWIMSQEVVPELGFPLGNRLMTFYLGPEHHPNVIAPGKQPRTTISPSLAFRHDQPWMVFGSMGGDQQDQWQLQYFLNRVVFNMTLQEAIEAPKLSSEHFPGFFSPHRGFCRRVRAEASIGGDVLQKLRDRGHEVDVGPAWSEGFLLAAERDASSGVIEAGCDPRGVKAEVFSPAARCW